MDGAAQFDLTYTSLLVYLDIQILILCAMHNSPDPGLLGFLLNREGKRTAFLKSIDKTVAKLRHRIKEGKKEKVGQWIDKAASSMTELADAMRNKSPKAAEAIIQARDRLQKVLEEETK